MKMFKKDCVYKCLHDVIKDGEILFSRNHIYKCTHDDVLIGNNQKEVCMEQIGNLYDLYNFFTEEFPTKYRFMNVQSVNEELPTNVRMFGKITADMLTLYAKKNADYGDSFSKSCNEFGITAALVRMQDKFNRIKNLAKEENQIKEESIKDTLIDLANYSIMTLIWYEQIHKTDASEQ